MKGNVDAIASYDVPRDAANLKQKVIVAGGNYRCENQARVIAGYTVMTAPAGFAATSNVMSGPIANDTSTFRVAANGSRCCNASFYHTRVSSGGIAANRYNTYALMAQYALSKRTILYAIVDHETATENGGLATASGDRTTASGDHTNTGSTAGIQLRF